MVVMRETGVDPQTGRERELTDGESLDGSGHIRPVPAGVDPNPEYEP